MSDAPKQVRCNNCHEWYDARANACYLCDHPRPEVNVALINAAHATSVNSHLSQQVARANSERRIRTPRGTEGGSGPAQLYNVPGARDLAARIKTKLREAGVGE